GILLIALLFASAGIGALSFSPREMLGYIGHALGWTGGGDADVLGRNVFLLLRLPRVLLARLTGAGLGVSRPIMQGLFRNPIVEPGLAGTSAGAALGAALMFVFGGASAFALITPLGTLGVPLLAFIGAFLATLAVYALASRFGKVNVFV